MAPAQSVMHLPVSSRGSSLFAQVSSFCEMIGSSPHLSALKAHSCQSLSWIQEDQKSLNKSMGARNDLATMNQNIKLLLLVPINHFLSESESSLLVQTPDLRRLVFRRSAISHPLLAQLDSSMCQEYKTIQNISLQLHSLYLMSQRWFQMASNGFKWRQWFGPSRGLRHR